MSHTEKKSATNSNSIYLEPLAHAGI